MTQFSTEAISRDSPFNEIVEAAHWQAGVKDQLRVAPQLGWLVMVGEGGELQRLIGFSSEALGTYDTLRPPTDLTEVCERAGTARVGWFDTDWTAKGLGSAMANTPQALDQRPAGFVGTAIRSVSCTPQTQLVRRDRNDSLSFQALRFIRHGLLLALSAAEDRATNSLRGTERAMAYMERSYGNASLVRMPAPPSWQYRQRKKGIVHRVEPQMALVRGGRFAADNFMQRVGSYYYR